MRINRFSFMRKLVLGLLSACLVGALPLGEVKAQAMPSEINVLIYRQADLYGIGIEKGWFDEAFPNTKVNFIYGSGAPQGLAGLASGSLDIVLFGSTATSVGLAQGIDLKVFYIFDVIDKAEQLVVRSSENINTAQDLKGKKIGTIAASTAEYALIGYLQLNGMTEEDLDLIYGADKDLYAAWARGDLDGAYTWQPFVKDMKDNGGKTLVTSGELADKGWGVMNLGVARSDFAKQYPEALKKFVGVMDRAVKYFRDDPKGSYEVMAKYMNVTPAEAEILLHDAKYLTAEEQKNPPYLGGGVADSLVNTSKVWVKIGRIKQAAPTDQIKASVTTDYLD
jgi:taurine transport system substrate-binding protein